MGPETLWVGVSKQVQQCWVVGKAGVLVLIASFSSKDWLCGVEGDKEVIWRYQRSSLAHMHKMVILSQKL